MPPDENVSDHRRTAPAPDEVEAVLTACRVLVALAARSISATSDVTDLLHIRALFVVSDLGSTSLSRLAGAVGIHLTRASRLCDRLVKAGHLQRDEDPMNRRQIALRVTPSGRKVVDEVRRRRAEAITPILAELSASSRTRLIASLEEFTDAAGHFADSDLWAFGWDVKA